MQNAKKTWENGLEQQQKLAIKMFFVEKVNNGGGHLFSKFFSLLSFVCHAGQTSHIPTGFEDRLLFGDAKLHPLPEFNFSRSAITFEVWSRC